MKRSWKKWNKAGMSEKELNEVRKNEMMREK